MADILVESFDADIGNGSTYTLTNDVGAVSSAFIHRTGPSHKSTGGPTGSLANTAPSVAHAGMALTDTDTITFYAGNTTSRKVIAEVWRYTGSSGGANEFIKRGSYALTLSGTTASTAISGISNRNKCVPFVTGISSSSASVNDYDSATVYAYVDASGNLVVGRNNSTVTVTVYVDVVEFTGSNWAVGHGISSSHDSVNETVTLNTDSTGSGGSTFDVGDWETAFIEVNMGGDTSETGLSDVLTTVYPAAGTTQVIFNFEGDGDPNAYNDSDGYIHVVQNDDLIVKYGAITNLAEGNGTYGTTTFPAGTNTSRSIDELAITFWADTTGVGTAFNRAAMQARITAATGTIQHWVHRSGNTIDVHYSVIDFSQLSSVSSDNLTADDLSVSIGIDSPAITQKHVLTGSALTAAIDLASPTIGQIHGLATNAIDISVSVDDSALAQIHGLTADELTVSTAYDSPVLSSSSADVLSADSLSVSVAIDTTAIGQRHALSGAGISASIVIDSPAIGQTHAIMGENIISNTLIDYVDIGQIHGLTAGALSIGSSVDIALFFAGLPPRETITLSATRQAIISLSATRINNIMLASGREKQINKTANISRTKSLTAQRQEKISKQLQLTGRQS